MDRRSVARTFSSPASSSSNFLCSLQIPILTVSGDITRPPSWATSVRRDYARHEIAIRRLTGRILERSVAIHFECLNRVGA